MPAELGSQAEVQANRLGVADVEISIGLGREAGLNAAAIFIGLQIIQNNVADKVRRPGFGGPAGCGFGMGIRGTHSVFLRLAQLLAARI